jgi:hypothetical protein
LENRATLSRTIFKGGTTKLAKFHSVFAALRASSTNPQTKDTLKSEPKAVASGRDSKRNKPLVELAEEPIGSSDWI